ncbi:MAG TPA: hypothetical protein VKR55_31390 [Bradyrhizobium sp.]|nr:hypothetical protein [Bradyrhizobium sp.]HLZ06636.1 hypothetical protein [Bradyrhizobium sp.]
MRATPIEQAAQGGHFGFSGNPRDQLLDIAAPFKFSGEPKKRGLGCRKFGAALGKISFAGPDLDAAITKLRDVFGAREQAIIEVERCPFNLKGRDLLAQRGDARGCRGFIGRRPLQDIGGIGIERDHGPKRLDGALRLCALSHVAANAANAVEPAQLSRFDLDFLLDGGVSIVRCLEGALDQLPLARGHDIFAQAGFGGLQAFFRLEILAVRRAARGPKRIGFSLHGLKRLAQARDAGACRKQHLADIVLRLQDVLAALLQARMIEAEHPRVEAAIRAREKWGECPLARRERHVVIT